MPDEAKTLQLTLHRSIHEIDAADWEACAGTTNPFVSHGFLAALEDSRSVGDRAGWLTQHAALRSAEGALLAVAPLYAKSHSYGEYVFDHGWADAFERAGGRYYPKLQVAVPFSPVPGPRLLARGDDPALRAALATALVQANQELRTSSVHLTFCREREWHELGQAGWLQRLGLQFHWENRSFACFDDFLGSLTSRKRKMIRKERERAREGIEIRPLRGPEIGKREWDVFYGFYRSTVDRKWGDAYLKRDFFPQLGNSLGERVVLMTAWRGPEMVAGALNLLGSDTLYGRNWGASIDQPFLHFELCYYAAIDFACANGLARVEAGAQGQHKITRGYLPRPTYSAHWIAHPGLRSAIAEFLERERPGVERAIAEVEEEASPFREERPSET